MDTILSVTLPYCAVPLREIINLFDAYYLYGAEHSITWAMFSHLTVDKIKMQRGKSHAASTGR